MKKDVTTIALEQKLKGLELFKEQADIQKWMLSGKDGLALSKR